MFKFFKKFDDQGYTTLVSVSIVSALGLTVAVGLLIDGTEGEKNSISLVEFSKAQAISQTCVAQAAEKIRDFPNFSGQTNVSLDEGDCTYTIINQGGEQRLIQVEATNGEAVKKVEVVIDQIYPQYNINSWQDVSTDSF